MKVTRTDKKPETEEVDAWKLPVGTVFTAKFKRWDTATYLKVFDGVIDLVDPNNTFMGPRDSLLAEEFEELEATLNVRRKDDCPF
jgi:hypothetical protein